MGVLRRLAWLFGILFLLGGFFLLVSSLSNSEGSVGGQAIGIIAMLIGALLCYGASKLKGRNGNTTASRHKPDDDSGGKPKGWDSRFDGALIQQQQNQRQASFGK